MVLENKVYVPTLAVRASEMNGLEFLPGATKDKITPCFLLAPWANSSTLERAVDRIQRAFPNRPYFLDLDRDYQFTNLESEPQRELVQLMDPTNGFENWVRFVEQHPNVWPCVQSRNQSAADMRAQIEAFQSMGRPYCMRIVRDRFPDNITEIVAAFSAGGAADFSVLLEGGWTLDPLSLAVWFSGVIAESLNSIDATVPFVLSCTSIPKMFTPFSDSRPTSIAFTNRLLVDQIARQTNRAHIIYGDWGSTRPREVGGFANRPLDRVDYPTNDAWLISRNKEDEWDYRRAAQAILADEGWDGSLGIWGEEIIRNTAVHEDLGINTPQKNVAARVNIHLHRQAFFDEPGIDPINFDEDWED